MSQRAIVLVAALCAFPAMSAQGQQEKQGLTKEELVSCVPQFERFRDAALKLFPENLETLRKRGSASWAQRVEADFEKMKGQSPTDAYWTFSNNHGQRLGAESAASAQKQLQTERSNLAVYKSGDQKKIVGVVGDKLSPIALDAYITKSEADICVLQLRIASLRTGKKQPAK